MKLEPKEIRKFIADSEIEAMSKIEILSLTDIELVLMVDSVINQSVNALVNTANALNGLFGNKNKYGFAMSSEKYKSGDTIICVVVPYYGGFTVGKEYKVITTYAGKLGLLRLKDDNGNESKHLSQYFKLKD